MEVLQECYGMVIGTVIGNFLGWTGIDVMMEFSSLLACTISCRVHKEGETNMQA